MKIMNELSYLEPAHRGDEHPRASTIRSCSSTRSPTWRAGLLDDDRRRRPPASAPTCRRAASSSSTTSATIPRRRRLDNFEAQHAPRAARGAHSSTWTRRTRSSTRSSRSSRSTSSRSPTIRGRPIFRGIFEDNDPTKRLMAIDQLQHRHLGFLGILGDRLQADRRIERSVQARRELHHLRDDALDAMLADIAATLRSAISSDHRRDALVSERHRGFRVGRRHRAGRQDESRPAADHRRAAEADHRAGRRHRAGPADALRRRQQPDRRRAGPGQDAADRDAGARCSTSSSTASSSRPT